MTKSMPSRKLALTTTSLGWDGILRRSRCIFGTPIQEGADIYIERYGPNRSMEYALNQYKIDSEGRLCADAVEKRSLLCWQDGRISHLPSARSGAICQSLLGMSSGTMGEYTSEEDIPSELRGRFSQRRHLYDSADGQIQAKATDHETL